VGSISLAGVGDSPLSAISGAISDRGIVTERPSGLLFDKGGSHMIWITEEKVRFKATRLSNTERAALIGKARAGGTGAK